MKVAVACHYSGSLRHSTLRKLTDIMSWKKYQSYETLNEDKKELIWLFQPSRGRCLTRNSVLRFTPHHTTTPVTNRHLIGFPCIERASLLFSVSRDRQHTCRCLSKRANRKCRIPDTQCLEYKLSLCDFLPVLRSQFLNILYTIVRVHYLFK